jgi:tRNA(Ile)-lysidine synthase
MIGLIFLMDALEKKVRKFIESNSLLQKGDRVLVGYSGGPDSTFLLLMLRNLWKECAALYVNHHLRGEESISEEQSVRKFCAERGIPLFVERMEWKTKPSNLEENARKRRYRHFEKAVKEQSFNKVALAHHSDDVSETFLLRLIRGSGPAGLEGIRPKRGIYIRPLLECTRSEILQYLKDNHVPYFTDTSNSDLSLKRNRIRSEMIPYIERQFNRSFRKKLADTAG